MKNYYRFPYDSWINQPSTLQDDHQHHGKMCIVNSFDCGRAQVTLKETGEEITVSQMSVVNPWWFKR